MTVEFIGMIAPQEYSEIIPPRGPVADPDFTNCSTTVSNMDGGIAR